MQPARCLAMEEAPAGNKEELVDLITLVEDDACQEDSFLPPVIMATGVKAKSPRTNKNVGIPHDMFGLVEWAAGDEITRAYIAPTLRSRTRCMGALLVAALEAHGCRMQPDGTYVRTDDPHFNRFEKLRAELQHAHAVAIQDLKEQLTAHLARISTLESQLTCAQAEGDHVRDALMTLKDELAKAQEASKQQASKHISVCMKAAKLRAQLAAHDKQAERLTVTRHLQKEGDVACSETRRLNPALVEELPNKQPASSKQSGSLNNAMECGQSETCSITPLQRSAGCAIEPWRAELVRRIVSEGKVAKQNIPIVCALCYTLHTGAVPPEESLLNQAFVDDAFAKLGALDAEKRQGVNSNDKYYHAIASDTGNRKHCAQYKGAMEVVALTRWDAKQNKPISEPIACKDLGNNQTALQGCQALRAVHAREGLRREKCTQVAGDSTEHAYQQRTQFVKGLASNDKATVENCYRHLIVLEEHAAMEAAFPGDEIINYLRMFHEVIHAQPEYYEELWHARYPTLPHVWEQLTKMPEPTSAKWEVPTTCARLFLVGLEVAPGKEGTERSMLEEFASFVLSRMRGCTDTSRPHDAGNHPHKLKWRALSALFASPNYLAGLYFYLDLWEFFGERHAFCLANSKFGDFPPSHHRHEMAVRVAKDSVWYEAACADTSTVFKQTTEYLQQRFRRLFVDRITDTLRAEMRTRMETALQEAYKSFQKWSAKVWTRARHLLGGVCDETYRAGVAQLVLILMGHGRKLGEKLADVQGGMQQSAEAITPMAAVDDVQTKLYSLIKQRHDEGELRKEWELWELDSHVSEWLALATESIRDTTINPVLSQELTPGVYDTYINMLFVGLSDNTRLESYVSLYKTFAHVNMTGATVELMFLYHAGLEGDRANLRACGMRSSTGGARRKSAMSRAMQGKSLTTHHGSKKQQQALCALALQKAKEIDRRRYFTRGEEGLKRKHYIERMASEGFRHGAAKRTVEAQGATCCYSAAGKKRRVEAPPQAYLKLLNPPLTPGAKAKARQGTGYSKAALTCKQKVAATEKKLARPPPGVSVPEPTRSGKRRTERHLRQLSCERPTRTAPTRAAAPRAAQLAAAEVEDEDNHMDTDDDDESHLQAAEQHAAEQAAFQARQEARRAELLRDGAEQARCREAEAARLTRATAEEEHRQREAQAARKDKGNQGAA